MSLQIPSNKTALVAGASSGIGRSIALQLASLQITHLILLARKEAVLQEVKKEAIELSGGKTKVDYVVIDFSLVEDTKRGIKVVMEKVLEDGEKIDYVFETQGTTPNGLFTPTKEGLDSHFAVQVLSRFAVPYLLLNPQHMSPQLSDAKSTGLLATDARVMLICAPAGPTSGSVDVDDLDMGKLAVEGKYGRGIRDMVARADGTGVALDSAILEFNDRYPSLTGIHIFPGVLPTDVGTKSFPGILGSIFTLVFKPLATALSWVGILDTVDGFAKGTIGMVLAGEKSKGLWNSKTRRCELGKWEGVKGNRLAVYEAMEKMVIEGGRGK